MKIKRSLKKTMKKFSFVKLQKRRNLRNYNHNVQKYKIKNDKMELMSNVDQLRGCMYVFLLF